MKKQDEKHESFFSNSDLKMRGRTKKTWKNFAVFSGGRKLMTIGASNLEEARKFCEGRLKGVSLGKPIYYDRIIELS